MRIKQKIYAEDTILRMYQEDITDDMLKKYMNISEDIFFKTLEIISPQKKDDIIKKILKDKKYEKGIKAEFKQDFRNWMARMIINYGFAKIEEQGYVVDKIIISPIMRMIMGSIEDDNGNKIMNKNRFWTAEVKVEEKAKDILLLSSFFEKKRDKNIKFIYD